MKKTIFRILCLSALALSYIFIFTTGRSQAQTDAAPETKTQAQTHSFPGVSTFMTSTGRLGFFEQATGKIFIYDSNFESCVFTGQLNKLGDPIVDTTESKKTKNKYE